MILPAILAFLAAVTFAANNATLRRGVVHGTLAQAMAVTLLLGLALIWIALAACGGLPLLGVFPARSVALFAAAGLLHFAFGRYCNYRATRAMGAVLVGPVQQTSVLVTLVLAIALLGETLTPLHAAGILLILAAPMLAVKNANGPAWLAWARRPRGGGPVAAVAITAPGQGAAPAGAFRPQLAEGYFFASLSALAFGASPILVREGMIEGSGMAGGLAGAAVAYSAATLAVAGYLALPGRGRGALAISRPALGWYAMTGLMAAASQVFVYMALAIAPASLVVPIQRTSIVMRVGLAKLLNPELESFDGRIVLATVASLAGAVALSVDPDWFRAP
ncbi:hypothetical protein GCM10023144_04130 [Pigmentiphaga soli]|uniref:EamA domain-containing protein n=1 Tax=Pigmentiphaga soli TaxID=1007095 RepID=A0ABP8GFP2_9BURK